MSTKKIVTLCFADLGQHIYKLLIITKNASKITIQTKVERFDVLFRCQQGEQTSQNKNENEVIKMVTVITTAIIALAVVSAVAIVCRACA